MFGKAIEEEAKRWLGIDVLISKIVNLAFYELRPKIEQLMRENQALKARIAELEAKEK